MFIQLRITCLFNYAINYFTLKVIIIDGLISLIFGVSLFENALTSFVLNKM